MFQTKAVQKIKTHILFSVTFFSENHAVYEMWKNIVERGRPRMTMRLAYWVSKATNTRTQTALTLITSAQQQWLHGRASMLRYTYID